MSTESHASYDSALCDHLLGKPYLYLDEMVLFIWDEFQVQVANSSIRRDEGWSKKAAKQKARQRNPEFRDRYFHFISDFFSYHLAYVMNLDVIKG
jgi:hypothetical protein